MEKIILTTTAELIDDKVKFKALARENSAIQIDYNKPVGDGDGYTSLEIFLISLSTCVSTAVISLLRKMNKTVKSYKITANGERRTEHPTCFSEVNLHIDIETDAVEKEIERAIKLSEESICPVWAMIKNNVKVNIGYDISSL